MFGSSSGIFFRFSLFPALAATFRAADSDNRAYLKLTDDGMSYYASAWMSGSIRRAVMSGLLLPIFGFDGTFAKERLAEPGWVCFCQKALHISKSSITNDVVQ